MMSATARWVHRVYRVRDLAETDRCVVCARATSRLRDADFGHAASTLHMTAPLPELRVCDACETDQLAAMRLGRKTVALAVAAPLAVVVLAAVVAPLGSPLVIVAAGFAGLVAARAAIAHVRRRRARAVRVLFVDGVGDEVILQIRLDAPRAAEAAPYREEARDPRTDGLVVAPVGPRVRANLAFVASTIAVAIGSVVAWFGSYPTLVLDNPGDADVEIALDGEPIMLVAGGSANRVVGWGGHRLEAKRRGAAVSTRLFVPWGTSVLVSTDGGVCYEVRGPVRVGAARIETRETSRIVRGPRVVMDQGERAVRARCNF